nr:MAG TPA: hypothetical protein [Caudoviricetes sp.]
MSGLPELHIASVSTAPHSPRRTPVGAVALGYSAYRPSALLKEYSHDRGRAATRNATTDGGVAHHIAPAYFHGERKGRRLSLDRGVRRRRGRALGAGRRPGLKRCEPRRRPDGGVPVRECCYGVKVAQKSCERL